MNFLSIPANAGKSTHPAEVWENEFVGAYPGITRAKLLGFDNHPASKAPILIENKIPVVMVYGDADLVVPYDENGRLFELEYENNRELLTVVKCPGRDHHPHYVPGKPDIIVDFIINHI